MNTEEYLGQNAVSFFDSKQPKPEYEDRRSGPTRSEVMAVGWDEPIDLGGPCVMIRHRGGTQSVDKPGYLDGLVGKNREEKPYLRLFEGLEMLRAGKPYLPN
jgi:hypothetical protein